MVEEKPEVFSIEPLAAWANKLRKGLHQGQLMRREWKCFGKSEYFLYNGLKLSGSISNKLH